MATKASWARRFVVQNIVLLTSPQGSIDLVKRKKQEFVAQHSLKSAEIFSNREIANALLSYLMETRRITTDEELLRVAGSSPFLAKCVNSNEIDVAKLRL